MEETSPVTELVKRSWRLEQAGEIAPAFECAKSALERARGLGVPAAGNPVFVASNGSWDELIYAPQVIFDEVRYHLWYSGCDASNTVCQVGYATSSDGIHWSKQDVVLPMGTGSDFDSVSVDYPEVLLQGNTFQMWYPRLDSSANPAYCIGYATAPALDKLI
jgi:hypothetical protein